jgi:histidine ammonia-lyase
MARSQTVALGVPRLTREDIDALARRTATAEVRAAARRRMQRSYALVQALTQAQVPIYGLTTGCGPLASQAIASERRGEFQRNLIRSHAVTLGAQHPTSFVRAAMAVRAHVLALGSSGVDPATVDLLAAMLNHGVHPLVREVGSVGASGDLVELAQVALALIGEGTVELRGALMPTADALRTVGLEPLVPRYREGLALINGTSFHTGAAVVLLARAERIAAAAQIAAAMILEALRGNLEAFDPAFQKARPHPGQRAVAERVAHIVAGSTLVRSGEAAAGSQDAYTLRCIPQVLGAVLDTLRSVSAVVDIEINSVIDNPLFLVDEERVVHGGNFHGQPVAMALDHLKTAMVEVGVMVERRIARVLDPTLNAGLPPFLIRDGAGLRSGFMGLQYCASSMAADNAVLAAPASVHSVPTNANNQDVVSMGMVAARQARHVLDNVERMVAIELLCAAQALDLRGAAHAGSGTRAAHALIRTHTAPLIEDRPLQDDVATVCQLIDDGTLPPAVDAADP